MCENMGKPYANAGLRGKIIEGTGEFSSNVGLRAIFGGYCSTIQLYRYDVSTININKHKQGSKTM